MSSTADQKALIEEQAADWFALIALGDASAQEKAEFDDWLQTSPLHAQAYEEMSSLWQDMEQLPEEAYSSEDSKEQTTQAEQVDIPKDADSAKIIPITRWSQKLTKVHYSLAASFLIACCGLMFAVLRPNEQTQLYSTGLAEVSDITLEDNSHITLDAKTHLEVSFTENQRLITMSGGRAFFRVASQKRKDGSKKPFIIRSGKMEITVVGTEFDVHIKNKEASVAVAEGKVEVKTDSSNDNVGLTAGQSVQVVGTQLDSLGNPEQVSAASVGKWRTGHLSYANATLKEVLDDARRYHKGSIVLGDESLGDLRVTTSFEVDQIPEMARTLEHILPVKVYLKPDNLILIMPKH